MQIPTIDLLENRTSRDHFIEYCQKYGADVVTYGPYRTIQIVWILVAIASMVNIVRVLWKYVKRSKLHQNIRILLTFFLTTALLLNLVFSIYQVYQLVLSFTATHPCDVFLPRHFYLCLNILFGTILELYLLIQSAMAFERTVATIYVRSYEQKKVLLAVIAAISTILVAAATQALLYRGKKIIRPEISVLNAPDEIFDRITKILIFNEVISGLNTALMITLVIVNKKREKKAIGDLSHRFQTEENIDTTKLIAKVALIQMLSYTSSSLGTFAVRLVAKTCIQYPPAKRTLNLVTYGMPVFTLIMSILIEYSAWTSAAYRRSRFQKAVNVKNEAQTYANFLLKQWNRK